jgi:CDP-diacylglycerol---glycerol-3-phosphate 3-phosphatidyltransferase
MNLPNKITIVRVCMIPFFLFFMLTDFVPNSRIIAAIIFIVAALTDALDGYLARKDNLVTNFGKFMDPLADKLLVSAALICFVEFKLVSSWIIIVIISREFIISGFRLVASDSGIVIAASYWGKFKTVAQMVMSILLIINFSSRFFNVLEQIFIYLSLVLTVISLIDYIYKNKNVLSFKN